MKRIILISAILAVFWSAGFSQAIRLVRTDVDSVRSGIITATFVFGVDIVLDSVQNCSNLSFQLKYNNANYIKFSGYKIGDFKKTGSSIVYLNPPIEDALTNEAIMNISVFSGLAPGENDFDNPNLLHLEFVVLQSAPVNQIVNFTFPKAEATAFMDSLAKNIKLKSARTDYRIHSFINVWPGDANNDNIVNTDDYSAIGLYMRKGADEKESRTFKRQNASTQWFAQRVLMWDVAAATYADCDGDGAVTVVDGLIVKLNDGKTGFEVNQKGNNKDIAVKDYYNNPPSSSTNKLLVPLNVYGEKNLIAFSGKINLEYFKDYQFLGILKGERFNSDLVSVLTDFDEVNSSLDFFITSQSKNIKSENENIAYLIFEPQIGTTGIPNISSNELYGYKTSGYKVKLNQMTDIENKTPYIYVKESSANIEITSSGVNQLVISTLTGEVFKTVSFNDYFALSKADFNSGVYFLKILSKNQSIFKKIIIE